MGFLSPFWGAIVVFTAICLAILLTHSSTGSSSNTMELQDAACDLVAARPTERKLVLNRSMMIIVNAPIFLMEVWNALQLDRGIMPSPVLVELLDEKGMLTELEYGLISGALQGMTQ